MGAEARTAWPRGRSQLAATYFLVTPQHGGRDEGLAAQLAPVLLVSLVDHLDVNV